MESKGLKIFLIVLMLPYIFCGIGSLGMLLFSEEFPMVFNGTMFYPAESYSGYGLILPSTAVWGVGAVLGITVPIIILKVFFLTKEQ